MTGLHDTDIRLTNDGGLTRAADGDAPICSDYDCIYQNIVLEAQTQPGDLFYDQSFGWGLYDFIQSEDDELVRIELTQRARVGLQKREVILPETVRISLAMTKMSSGSAAPFGSTERMRTESSTPWSEPLAWR